MKTVLKNKRLEAAFKWVLIIGIILYPLVHTFLGIDLGDTGYHIYAFQNIYKNPDMIGFTSYFTSVTGWVWLQLFGNLGLWGLNFLEFLIEMLMAFVVYRTFRGYLGEHRTLLGILIAVMASDTYLNVFNYHQYNVMFLVLILCFEFRAIVSDRKLDSLFAGIFFAMVVFSRMGSITAIITLALYLFWYFVNDKKGVFLSRHILSFASGTVLITLAMVILLTLTNQLDNFVNNIFRLSGLASQSEGGYSMGNLWESFITGNFNALASGFIYVISFIVLLLGINIILQKRADIKKKIVDCVIALLAVFVACYQMIYAFDVNPVPSWPQMTTGPGFFIGLFYVIAFLTVIYHLYSKNGKKEIALIGLAAVLLPILTIAGSNTGTKHVIMGFWIIAPLCSYVVFGVYDNNVFLEKINECTEKIGLQTKRLAIMLTIGVMVLFVGFKFVHMIYYTTNFDSVDRSMLNSEIDNKYVKGLKTTEREASAVNGTLEMIEEVDPENEHSLVVFGSSILYYYMLEKDSYVQPWFSNPTYSNELLTDEIEEAKNKFDKLPIVIYGRTNNNYGFYEYNYESLLESQRQTGYEGKKDILIEFLDENNYSMEYLNDYYMVMLPPDMASEEGMDYYYEMTGYDR